MPQTSLLSFFPQPKASSLKTSGFEDGPKDPLENDNGPSTTGVPCALPSKDTSVSILEQVQMKLSASTCPITVPHLPHALVTILLSSHVPAIQRLTSTTLPVRYSDSFFLEPVNDPIISQLTRVVLYSSEPVGWIRCRLEPCSPNPSCQPRLQQIYIQALALLAPYRGSGLATILLDTILKSPVATANSTVAVYAHVWEKNDNALEWYASRGFKRVMLVERYYRRLKPGGAWIVRRDITHTPP